LIYGSFSTEVGAVLAKAVVHFSLRVNCYAEFSLWAYRRMRSLLLYYCRPSWINSVSIWILELRISLPLGGKDVKLAFVLLLNHAVELIFKFHFVHALNDLLSYVFHWVVHNLLL